MSDKEVEVGVAMSIIVPTVPNFIHQKGRGVIPIGSFTDEALQSIGEAFTEELIKKAQEKRKEQIT